MGIGSYLLGNKSQIAVDGYKPSPKTGNRAHFLNNRLVQRGPEAVWVEGYKEPVNNSKFATPRYELVRTWEAE